MPCFVRSQTAPDAIAAETRPADKLLASISKSRASRAVSVTTTVNSVGFIQFFTVLIFIKVFFCKQPLHVRVGQAVGQLSYRVNQCTAQLT